MRFTLAAELDAGEVGLPEAIAGSLEVEAYSQAKVSEGGNSTMLVTRAARPYRRQ